MDTINNINGQLVKSFNNAEIYFSNDDNAVLIVKSTQNYIPENQFREIFNYITDTVLLQNKVKKLVFDKRSLSVFNQPSMEWYYTQWKEKASSLGLKTHRKILPDDDLFNKSVKIGRESIMSKYPEGHFKQLDIQYRDSLEEAIGS
ncbi:hypothetical protein OO013_01150 [Mangrovivirga sp. M17]|uniref:Uncharacterized protein n=1 Tax=Mangrovivirga halotolerans TaxID=2993936 RepID=A0ABT3RKU1_9BACT|nr:hypothetical protein [Mangrovivirga halotolerans]MCX2742448.1 hypothetical protein [Mangrovivirga halotolerans]